MFFSLENRCSLGGLSIGYLGLQNESFSFPNTFLDGYGNPVLANPVPINIESWLVSTFEKKNTHTTDKNNSHNNKNYRRIFYQAMEH